MIGTFVAVIAALLLLWALVLWFIQERLIYVRRQYHVPPHLLLPTDRGKAIHFQMPFGRCVAYYVAPLVARERLPERLWVFFGGNASLALDWLDFALTVPDTTCAGILLIEYPGYGENPGRPSRLSIAALAEAAFQALAMDLGVAPEKLERNIGVLGASLGCAAGLDFASNHRVDRVILLAGFTSMRAMAKRAVGWPFCELVRDRYDNVARLSELASRNPRPGVWWVHGDADEVVPVAMGREIAARFPDFVVYHEIPGGNHVTIVELAEPLLRKIMR